MVAAKIWAIDFLSNLDAFNGILYCFNIMLFINQRFCQIAQLNRLSQPIPNLTSNGECLLIVVNGSRRLPHHSIANAKVTHIPSLVLPISNLTGNGERLFDVVDSSRRLPHVGIAVAEPPQPRSLALAILAFTG